MQRGLAVLLYLSCCCLTTVNIDGAFDSSAVCDSGGSFIVMLTYYFNVTILAFFIIKKFAILAFNVVIITLVRV